MKKNAWNWVIAIVLTLAAGMVAHDSYLLLQGRNGERGDWGFTILLVCLSVISLNRFWDDPDRSKNAADAPQLTISQGPKKADSD